MGSLAEINNIVMMWALLLCSITIVFAAWLPKWLYNRRVNAQHDNAAECRDDLKLDANVPASFAPVEPLPDFEWQVTEPRQYRPFKPKYHLTMSLENATVSELIEMDKNYLDRILLRRQIIRESPLVVLGANDLARPAVNELYTWLVGTYLPKRYPRMFRIQQNPISGKSEMMNIVTSEYYPLKPLILAYETLQLLGGLLDDDFLFLVKSPDGDGYRLQAFVTCFPNGFDTSRKLNLKLRDIHKPVPGYKEKLEKSMDRWFERLEAGKYVRRTNWTITTTSQLFTAAGNHLYEGEIAEPVEANINETRVRCERQVVHRLPTSKAIVFSFKTYLYPLRDIKEEGLGPDLAAAIDGLKDGNVPGMHFYKRAAVWGESVKRFLLSE